MYAKERIIYLKKLFSILLSSLILISSNGFSLSIDYCPFQKKTILSIEEKQPCCCGGNQSVPNGCCNHKKIVVEKIKDTYTPSIHSKVSSPILLLLCTSPSIQLFSNFDSQKNYFSLTDKAPPSTSVPFTILYRSILI